jgi:hypothetical protein
MDVNTYQRFLRFCFPLFRQRLCVELITHPKCPTACERSRNWVISPVLQYGSSSRKGGKKKKKYIKVYKRTWCFFTLWSFRFIFCVLLPLLLSHLSLYVEAVIYCVMSAIHIPVPCNFFMCFCTNVLTLCQTCRSSCNRLLYSFVLEYKRKLLYLQI